VKRAKKIAWEDAKSVAENARRELPRRTAPYFQAGRKLVTSKMSTKALHRFRLETKRFRYSLELFVPVYGPGLERRLASLRWIQDCLGEINDCVTTRRLLMAGRKQARGPLARLLVRLDRLVETKRRQFARHWQTSFDAPGQVEKWEQYLSRFAGRVGGAQRAPEPEPEAEA